jgi:hypothetical protein
MNGAEKENRKVPVCLHLKKKQPFASTGLQYRGRLAPAIYSCAQLMFIGEANLDFTSSVRNRISKCRTNRFHCGKRFVRFRLGANNLRLISGSPPIHGNDSQRGE